MASFQKHAEKMLDWFIAFAVVMIVVVVVTLQVASRYLFSSPYDWTEEIARLLFVWIAFLGVISPSKPIPIFRLRPSSNASFQRKAKRGSPMS